MPFETLIPLIKPLFDGLRAVKNFFRKENEESKADGRGGKGGSGTISSMDAAGAEADPTVEEAEMAASYRRGRR